MDQSDKHDISSRVALSFSESAIPIKVWRRLGKWALTKPCWSEWSILQTSRPTFESNLSTTTDCTDRWHEIQTESCQHTQQSKMHWHISIPTLQVDYCCETLSKARPDKLKAVSTFVLFFLSHFLGNHSNTFSGFLFVKGGGGTPQPPQPAHFFAETFTINSFTESDFCTNI